MEMDSSYRVDLPNLIIVRHGHVDQLRHEFPGGGLADEEPHLLKGIGHPGEEDEKGDADGADGIEIPNETIAHDGHDQAEDVDGDIVAMVNLACVSKRQWSG